MEARESELSELSKQQGTSAPDMRQIEVPALWIGGEESPWSAAKLAARLDQINGLSRMTLPGAGHMVQHHVPEPLAKAVAAFIAGLVSPIA